VQERHSELLGPVQVVHAVLQAAHLLVEISLKVPAGQIETHDELDPSKKRFPVHERHVEADAPEQVRQLGLHMRHAGVGVGEAYWPASHWDTHSVAEDLK